jgi:hypothetical protein
MGVLFLTTVISCSQLNSMMNRVIVHTDLSVKQKTEIIEEFRKVIPSCPLVIKSK